MKNAEIVVLFFILIVSLSGLTVIFSYSNPGVTGELSIIDSILNWFKPLPETPKAEIDQQIEEEKVLEQEIEKSETDPLSSSVVGRWRPYQQNIAYDAGAVNAIKRPVTRWLTINADETWEFGSTGTWEIKEITQEDWEKWGISPYSAATKKIILYDWNDTVGEGPIDEGIAGVDFLWVFYRSEKLSLGPATIQIKFGH